MERWGLDMAKEYFKFSAAHFLIFPDGSAERLHGHNYRVFVELDAGLDQFGLVLDFKQVKPVVRELCDFLDEHFLVPGLHAELGVGPVEDGHRLVVYRATRYLVPDEDLIVLPINNSSSENLATWFARRLKEELESRFVGVQIERLQVAVEETSGQRGVYLFTRDGDEG
ncbi:MAG: 6-carboxytetrahydropterin synthase [Planctomycetota bacterium]|nr:6-carboxytetrahydropterin synthase [Planctomycetota bacterium]